MWTPEIIATVAACFLLAGLVKGVVGVGLPIVSLGLLTAIIGLKEAMALTLVPALLANVWQALDGKALGALLRRLWSLLLVACITVWFGVALLARGDAALLSGLLGLLLCLYGAISLTAPPLPPPGRHEGWLAPLVGAVNGVVTGLTGVYAVPGVFYLQALRLTRDELIQAMGVLFTVSTVALGANLGGHGLLPAALGLGSAAAVLPTVLGMLLGRALRRRLSERRFRQVFLISLLVLGIYIIVRALLR
jgi:uncharacterized membrane protein YfcA